MAYGIYRKVNMFTTAAGREVPVLEMLDKADSIPQGADIIASIIRTDQKDLPLSERDQYFLAPLEDE